MTFVVNENETPPTPPNKSDEVADKIQEVMDTEPDVFLAEAIILMEGKTLAERRRIGKAKAHRAAMQAELSARIGDRFQVKSWNRVSWTLKTTR